MLLVPLLAVLAYAIGLSNGYVYWDDDKYILFNPHMTAPDGLRRIWFTFESPQYYPLTFTSFWLEYRLWGPDATGYFVTNVLLHAVNSVLIFAVARAVGLSRAAAWLCACLFAVHPIQVASVAWLAQRKNVLSGAFALASMLLYLRFARRGGGRFYAGCLLAYTAALLSKTAVVTVPLSLLLADLLIFRRQLRGALQRVAPMILLAVGLGIVTAAVEQAASIAGDTALRRMLAAPAALWFYVGTLAAPVRLLGLYPHWDIAGGSILWWLPLIALLACGYAVWRRRDAIHQTGIWGAAHFVVTLGPVIGLVGFGYLKHAPVGDHFTYLAGWGLFLGFAMLLEHVIARTCSADVRKRVFYVIAGLLIAVLGVRTAFQVRVWHDGERFWSHTLAHNPNSALAHNNLGAMHARKDRLGQALSEYRQAVRLDPVFWMARVNVGIALRDLGRIDESIAEFRQMAASAPKQAAVHYNLGVSLERIDDTAGAIAAYRRTLQLDPAHIEALSNLGNALVTLGSPAEAAANLREALERNPDDAVAHFNFAVALAMLGDLDRAIRHYRESLRLQPQSPKTWTNLGLAQAAQGRGREAIESLRTALRFDPQDALALLNLGTLLAQSGQASEAAELFRDVLRIEPENIEALNNLGTLLAQQGRFAESIPLLAGAVQLRPDHANSRFMLGWALSETNRSEEAIPHFRSALQIQPNDYEARYRLGRTLQVTGRTVEAMPELKRSLELNPRYAAPAASLAWILAVHEDASVRDPAEAVRLAELARDLTGGRRGGPLDVLAAAYASAGRFDDAVQAATTALEIMKADNNGDAAQVELRLEAYRNGRPATGSTTRPPRP